MQLRPSLEVCSRSDATCKAHTCRGGSLAAVQASAGLLGLPALPRSQQPLQPEVAQSCAGQPGPCCCLQHAGQGPPIQLEAALQVHRPQAGPCPACTSRQQCSACIYVACDAQAVALQQVLLVRQTTRAVSMVQKASGCHLPWSRDRMLLRALPAHPGSRDGGAGLASGGALPVQHMQAAGCRLQRKPNVTRW